MSPHVSSSLAPDSSSALSVAPGIVVPPEALEFTFSRSGGPGGQNVNKLSTRAQLRVPMAALAEVLNSEVIGRLRHQAGSRLTASDDLLFVSSDSRSQSDNRRQCLEKLRQLLVAALRRPKIRKPTRPSRSAKQRRLVGKKVHSERKNLRRRIEHGT